MAPFSTRREGIDDVGQCGSHVSHLQFELQALLWYEVYYLHPKHSFHVIHPGLPIEPNFPLHGLTCTDNPGMEPAYQASTSYMQHLSTR